MVATLAKITYNFPEPSARHMPVAQHDWWFNIYGTDEADLGANLLAIFGHLTDYYCLDNAGVISGVGGHNHPSAYFANQLSAPTYRVAQINQTTGHEIPGTIGEGTIPGWSYNRITAAADLPAEVALCQSWGADLSGLAGRHKARARGRVYLGPFSTAALSTTVSYHARTSLVQAMNLNHKRMSDAIAAMTSEPHCTQVIYSRVDHTPRPVTGGWVDEEWDTQRRRSGFVGPLGSRQAWA